MEQVKWDSSPANGWQIKDRLIKGTNKRDGLGENSFYKVSLKDFMKQLRHVHREL